MDLVNWTQLLGLLKQYGPLITVLLVLVYWFARRIDKLIDRNTEIYEAHVKQLCETQKWLLTKLIGPQPSSSDAPTVKQLKDTVAQEKAAPSEKEDKK